jgi:hypothetical protein
MQKSVLEFKASLIAVKGKQVEQDVSQAKPEIINNIQPISVGVWSEEPSSSELSLN